MSDSTPRSRRDAELAYQVDPGDIVGEKYRIVRVLAEGGMGVVFEATQEGLGRRVALKMLRKHSPERVARFAREARAASTLTGPHVVRIFDVGGLATGELPFIAMEFLEGRDLATLIAESPPTPELALDLVLQACEGLAEAHAAGIVHRDIKPSNLFLAREGGGEVLKVLDFGISKQRSEEAAVLTATENALGTPLYMSPEQVRDAREVDARSDVWSLGVVLHELLSGKRPFRCDSAAGAGAAIVADEPTHLTVDSPDTPASLEKIVLRCLEKDSAARYPSVVDLAESLQLSGIIVDGERIARVRRAAGSSPHARHRATSSDATDAETVAPSQTASPETLAASSRDSASTRDAAPDGESRSLGLLGLGLLFAAALAAGVWITTTSAAPEQVAPGSPPPVAAAATVNAPSEVAPEPILASPPAPSSSAAATGAPSGSPPVAKASAVPRVQKAPSAAPRRVGPLDSRD